MPHGVGNGTQLQGGDHPIEERAQNVEVAEPRRIAATRVGDPFAAACEHYCCAVPHSEQNFAVRDIEVPQFVQNFVAPAGVLLPDDDRVGLGVAGAAGGG